MESIIDQRPLRVSGGPDTGVGQMWGLLEWVGSCIVAPVDGILYESRNGTAIMDSLQLITGD